jgi:hypothetical protein
MVKKWVFVAGAGIGYVLGTRAGREKYNAMAARAREILDKPTVKEASGAVQAEATRLYGEGKNLVRDKVRELRERSDRHLAETESEPTVVNGTSVHG